MKPLNLDNKPCSPISSNCVIWQGPDISCINICKGDSVSDVVAALATELCTILDQTNVSNYDLSCLGITACGPKDFQALIQLLIEKICELQGITPGDTKSTGNCPDCVVTVAPCFRTGNQTTMQLLDYVQMIAEKVCALIDEIDTINNQISEILIRLEELENASVPESQIPSFTLQCDIGSLRSGTTQFINTVLQEFINNVWCPFYAATGSTGELISAVNAICIEDGDLQLTTNTAFSTNPNWIQSGAYNTVADAINNIWVALCDVYNAVGDISLNVTDTNTVNLTLSSGVLTASVQDTGWQNLDGFEWYGNNSKNTRPQCRRIGNVVYFRGTVMVPLASEGTGTPITWDYTPTNDTYFNITTTAPSVTGAGSVVLNVGGSVAFNQGNALVPTSVVPLGQNFDTSYSTGSFLLAFRFVKIYQSEDGNTRYSGLLTTLFRPIITNDKKLILQMVKDNEISAGSTTGTQPYSTSLANNLISHVMKGAAYVPLYQGTDSTLGSSAFTGMDHTINLPLPLGDPAGDDYTQYIKNTGLYYERTLTYPFEVDANNQEQVGGFGFIRLDGMSAFLDPCAATIPTPEPCPKGVF